ncbi:MAG: hypothetical protein IT378_04080 [Sandaracinaceae bacterium]|nr:hypothetical protein [Sandaracinaceae bacterium]
MVRRVWATWMVVLASCGGGSPPSEDGGSGLDGSGALDAAADCATAPDGTACAAGRVCFGGACEQTRCGDGFVESITEQCDDGNDIAFDGCTACAFDCTEDRSCDDLEPCNGSETCDVSAHRCTVGTALADGASCATSALPAGACRSETCISSECGNSVTETAQGEECDDGANGDDTDGCTDLCQFTCEIDSDCDDASVCTGAESCTAAHTCTATGALDCDDGSDCTENLCDPVNGCSNPLIDGDGDGYASDAILSCGTDCNDARADVSPGQVELCDSIDHDCNGNPDPPSRPVWFPDCDGDGYAPLDSIPLAVQDCDEPAPGAGCADWTARRPMAADPTSADCNDADPRVRPLAIEATGDSVDGNCDGTELCFEDLDNDGYARTDGRVVTSSDADCNDPGEATASDPATDCDDARGNVYPSAPETAGDEIDQSCDGRELCHADGDGDGYRTSATILSVDLDCRDAGEALATAMTDCDDADAAIRPGAMELTGDEVDQDCDNMETCYLDNDDDGYRLTSTIASSDTDCGDPREARASDPTGDCNDSSAAIRPGATETIGDGVDQSCDGLETCYTDSDGDGARTTAPVASADADCVDTGEALATAPLDCNDGSAAIRPGATEIAGDGVDQSCDGAETCYSNIDGDGYRTDVTRASTDTDCADAGEALSTLPSGDCNDNAGSIYPGATEVTGDGVDQSCDGREVCWANADGDAYRSSTATVISADADCVDAGEALTTMMAGDCSDGSAAIHPGAAEITGDEVDQDCDSREVCWANMDGDAYRSSTATVMSADTDCVDAGEARTSVMAGDCNDGSASIHPAATEVVADGVDQNCDGGELCHRDIDGDGVGSSMTTSSADLDCMDVGEAGIPAASFDCCDTDPNARPGQTSYFQTARNGCGGYDYNCDGTETRLHTAVNQTGMACWGSPPLCIADQIGWRGGTAPACGGTASFNDCNGTNCSTLIQNVTQRCR